MQQSSVKLEERKIPCSSWWCCCHLSLLLRGTLMQPKRLLLAAKWTADVGRRSQAGCRDNCLFSINKACDLMERRERGRQGERRVLRMRTKS